MIMKIQWMLFLWVMVYSPIGIAVSAFKTVDLDNLIVSSVPNSAGTVEILPFLKIQFPASINQLPKPRKTSYLQEIFVNMNVNPIPIVKQGIELQSNQGKTINFYIEQSIADKITAEHKVGDKLQWFGYKVYNSKYGPGVLISGFEYQD